MPYFRNAQFPGDSPHTNSSVEILKVFLLTSLVLGKGQYCVKVGKGILETATAEMLVFNFLCNSQSFTYRTRESRAAPSLAVFKAGGWNWMSSEVPSKPFYDSMISVPIYRNAYRRVIWPKTSHLQ